MLARMLVRFKSDVGGFTSFGDVAVKLLRMAGHSGTVPGAIPAEGIAEALSRLEAALDSAAPEPEPPVEEEAEAREPPVSLRQRAFPMLEMFRGAIREECGVMWDEG
jgi:hypothetical protein